MLLNDVWEMLIDFDPNILLKNFIRVFLYDEKSPMLFNSGAFLFLFTIFISIYAVIYRHPRVRVAYILVFSLFFYYKSSGIYLIILLFSIVLDYLAALWIRELLDSQKKGWARVILIVSICANVGLLVYFKYTNLILQTINDLVDQNYDKLELFLPIGISFYTFQTLSYVIDVYNGLIPPRKNLLDYAFYMSFFPHLVAGPIVRAKDFLPQIDLPVNITKEDIGQGFYLILKGLVKKAIIADYVAQYCDLVFTTPHTYSGFESLMAVYGYTLQIYCDFSGYSDMAIGLALIMGYKLGLNFNVPYISTNVTEFWRRWHISLSSWLRDYLYIPFGGNRKGEFRTYLHLFATMFIGGLWHGAGWKFVWWGAMHGVGLAVHKLFLLLTKKIPKSRNKAINLSERWMGWFITFHFVAFLWVFFRANTFDDSLYIISKIFYHMDFSFAPLFVEVRSYFVAMLGLGYALHFVPESIKIKFPIIFTNLPSWVKVLLFLVVIQLIIEFKDENVQPFIYFQF